MRRKAQRMEGCAGLCSNGEEMKWSVWYRRKAGGPRGVTGPGLEAAGQQWDQGSSMASPACGGEGKQLELAASMTLAWTQLGQLSNPA